MTIFSNLRSPIRDMVVEKFGVSGKNVGWKGILIYFCILSQNFCVPWRNFFVFSQKYLRSLTSPVEFGQTLPVYSSQGFQLRIFTMERFLEFYIELGLTYKEIQSMLSSRRGF